VICRCRRSYVYFVAIFFVAAIARGGPSSDFRFHQDTLSFVNSTVFEYSAGHARVRSAATKDKKQRYTRRCFIMSRTVMQFKKFARFDPHGAPLDDKELTMRIRNVTHRPPWHDALPAEKRIVFPGYANLRAMSEARGRVLQKNIGLGWPTYLRVGNSRMFYLHNKKYQEQTHSILEAALARNEFFVAYLSDFPILHINHSVLVYAHKPARKDGNDHYLVYDPNHPDGPRELKWLPAQRAFDFQKDQEFVGGFTRVFQVYGKPFQ
jgi:hypothetical protein